MASGRKSYRRSYWIPRSDQIWKDRKVRARTFFIPVSLGMMKDRKFVDYYGVVWPACGTIPDRYK